MASEAGATDLFVPSAEELTQDGIITVDPGYLGDVMCGKSRPGHFRGVATIVLKLFNLIEPTVAVFGWKDAQQLILIRKMVNDLNVPVRIIGEETVREPDGLAMSSRNAYLTPAERAIAPLLYKTLREIEARMLATPQVIPQCENDLCRSLSGMKEIAVDYCELRSMVDLRQYDVR